jgi:hypothetical protein
MDFTCFTLTGWPQLVAFANAITSCYDTNVALSPTTLVPGWLGVSVEDYDGLACDEEDYVQEVSTDGVRTEEDYFQRVSCATFLGDWLGRRPRPSPRRRTSVVPLLYSNRA